MQQSEIRQSRTEVMVNTFIVSVYNWMAIGLAITGVVAYFVSNSQTMLRMIFGNPFVFIGLIVVEIGLVFYISGRISKMEASTATFLFLLYSALNGATLSAILIYFARATIATAFFVCAGTFIACSIYGYITKKDLTSLGGFMFMGLIGIIIASVVNLFLQSAAVTMIISYIGVFVFIGLTAYDTQKIKHMAQTQPSDAEAGVLRKGAILGALSLYLDFINMFIFMLHIFGGRE